MDVIIHIGIDQRLHGGDNLRAASYIQLVNSSLFKFDEEIPGKGKLLAHYVGNHSLHIIVKDAL